MKPQSKGDVQRLLKTAVDHHVSQRLAEAESGYREVLAIDWGNADAHYNLGLVQQASSRLAEAEQSYRCALELKPANASAWNNLGNVLRDTRRWDEARDAFQRAIQLKPDHLHARMNLALALLSAGRYEEAWPLYETRLVAHKGILPALACPRWNGEALKAKRILVVCEQGYGDAVQFVRYAPMLKARGAAHVAILCRAPLAPLLSTCAGVDQLVPIDDGTHDWHVPLLSVPHIFGTRLDSIPSAQPYLHARSDRVDHWQRRLPPSGFRVGLAWKGNAGHANDANRSMSLAHLAALWRVPGITFVSLQKGAGEDEALHPPDGQPMLPLSAGIRDFGDLAALVSLMDIVICVDTAVAHVAGALGKTCWVLLPAVGCDWRWFGGANEGQAPWYPANMRLFHQRGNDWLGAMEDAAHELGVLKAAV